MRIAAICAALLGAGAAATAQVPELPTLGADWVEASYPKLFWSARNGFTLGLYYGQIRPMGYDDYDDPQRYHASLSLNGQISSGGRKDIQIAARMPKLVDGWRFVLEFNAFRHPRDYYFGIGNATPYFSDSAAAPGQEHFYDVDRRSTLLRGEAQRRIVGPLRALGGFHIERWRLAPQDGPSVLANDLAAGTDPTLDQGTHDSSFRFGLVFDTRDDEVAPQRGLLIQLIHGIADSSLIGELSYTRTTGSVAGFVPVGPKTVVAARVVGQRMGGTPRVGSYYLVEASDDPYEGLGSEDSHRALQDTRFLGRHKLFANLDVRYDVFRIESLIAVTLLGFLDAGRVFETEAFRLTTDDLHVGGGGGLFLRWGRSGVFGTTLGVGPDGTVVQVNTSWAY